MGDIVRVSELADANSVNILNENEESPLRVAYYKGLLDSIILLEKKGAKILPPLANR